MIKQLSFLIVALAVAGATVNAQQVFVADTATINLGAGEAQSTVVAPGKKTQCQQGRFLVTNDGDPPPGGVVWGRNIDNANGPVVGSIFEMGSLGANYSNDLTKTRYVFGTNDHDLVTLSNGDVLYFTGAFSRVSNENPLRAIPLMTGDGGPVQPGKNPSWFDDTFRDICINKDGYGKCIQT